MARALSMAARISASVREKEATLELGASEVQASRPSKLIAVRLVMVVLANGLRLSCGPPAPQTRKMASIERTTRGGASGPTASSAG